MFVPMAAVGSSGRGWERGRQGHRVARQVLFWDSGTAIEWISSIAMLSGSKKPRKGL